MKPISPINELNDFIERFYVLRIQRELKTRIKRLRYELIATKSYNLFSPSRFSDKSKVNDFFEHVEILFSIKDLSNLRWTIIALRKSSDIPMVACKEFFIIFLLFTHTITNLGLAIYCEKLWGTIFGII